MIFENSLPLPERQFYRNRGPAQRVGSPSEARTICGVGKDLIILRLRPCRLAFSANSTLAGFRDKAVLKNQDVLSYPGIAGIFCGHAGLSPI
ncbi:MAG: hypothetical protein B1H11_13145 [Desulfobacteraceae bacterium 4484_190.1]|nr:MAG: hypothetical protein B1H11_13145 [Desulfobacteraceae bacterium 4484_190.1]